MSRKLFSLFIVLVILSLSSISAMAQDDDPFASVGDPDLEGKVSWYLGGESPFYFEIAEAFEAAYPNIELEVMATPWGEWTTRFTTLAAAGEMPDVVWFIAGQPGMRMGITPWAGYLFDLSPFAERIEEGDIIDPSLLESSTVDGELLGLPYEFNNIVLYYNKDMFDAAGLEYPNADWTWDELLEAGRALTADDGSQYGLVWSQFEDDIVLGSAGVTPLALDGSGANYDTDEAVVAYEFLYDMYIESGIAPRPDETAGISLDAGTAAMEVHGNWRFGTYQGAGINFGSTLIPAGPAGHTTLQRANIWSVSEDAECMACVLTFVEFLVFGEGQDLWAASGRLAPWTRYDVDSYLEATGTAGTDYEETFIELMNVVFENAQYAMAMPQLSPDVDNNDLGQIVDDERYLLFVQDSQDIATTLANIDAQLEAYLESKE